MQIRLKMEAGDCPMLNVNAMENYLLSHSLNNRGFNCANASITGINGTKSNAFNSCVCVFLYSV